MGSAKCSSIKWEQKEKIRAKLLAPDIITTTFLLVIIFIINVVSSL
jgi:hypothetical protein